MLQKFCCPEPVAGTGAGAGSKLDRLHNTASYYSIIKKDLFYFMSCRTTEEEGLASGRDFKILAGAVIPQLLTGLHFLPNSSGVVTTSRGQPGYQLWTVQPGQDELQLAVSPPLPPGGQSSQLIPSGCCLSESHVYLSGIQFPKVWARV